MTKKTPEKKVAAPAKAKAEPQVPEDIEQEPLPTFIDIAYVNKQVEGVISLLGSNQKTNDSYDPLYADIVEDSIRIEAQIAALRKANNGLMKDAQERGHPVKSTRALVKGLMRGLDIKEKEDLDYAYSQRASGIQLGFWGENLIKQDEAKRKKRIEDNAVAPAMEGVDLDTSGDVKASAGVH